MSNYKTLSILITALGGEGGGTLMNWILDCARKENLFVQGTSIPGVAQRTGSTSYYLEICDQNFEKGKEPVLSLYPKPGRVDVVIASELLEAARVIEKGYVNPDKTLLITSSSRTYTNLEKSHLADGRFNEDKILAACNKMSKSFVCLDLNKIALTHSTIVSAPMFGALAGCNVFPWSKKTCETIFSKNDFGKNSLEGFNFTYSEINSNAKNIFYDNSSVSAISVKKHFNEEFFVSSLPTELSNLVALGQERCVDYQNKKYAELYVSRIKKIVFSVNLENEQVIPIIENIVRRLSLWMTYEDIPRVAQHKIKPERFIKIKEEIKIQKNQILLVQDIFKPGINEIGAMLPRKIGQFFIRNNKIMSFLPFIGKGMKINSLTIFGFLSLKFLATFRYIRTISLRYNEEQKNIEKWINNIIIALSKSLTFAEGLADMPQILKGYGDTWDKGKIKYNMINSALVENKMGDLDNSKDGEILKQAILICMNDTEIEKLEIFLTNNS